MNRDVRHNVLEERGKDDQDAVDWVLQCGDELRVHVGFRRGVMVLSFHGELSGAGSARLDDVVDLLADVGLFRVVFDLGELSLVGSAGLEGLVRLVQQLRAQRSALAVVGLDPIDRRAIEAGWPDLDLVDRLAATIDAAMGAVTPPWPAGVEDRDALVAELVQLRRAMQTRATIEQAKGILMAQRRCTADSAFEVLVQASRRTNTRLAELAANLVEHTAQPGHGRRTGTSGSDGHDGRHDGHVGRAGRRQAFGPG
jgi:two-component system, response regulator / RNA-binding antiterminator